MNLRAKCVNNDCPAFGIEKSVMVGQLAGYGAPNDRVVCPVCGQLMRTTKSINVSKGKMVRKVTARTTIRWSTPPQKSKTATKRTRKRSSGKRY